MLKISLIYSTSRLISLAHTHCRPYTAKEHFLFFTCVLRKHWQITMISRALLRLNKEICSFRTYKSSGVAELTQVRYNVKRGNFATLNDKDVSFFTGLLGGRNVIQEDIEQYNLDFMNNFRGSSKLVLKPGSVDEISAIMEYCNQRKLAVCPQGGNTGMVGGSVPVFDEIVLSMQRLNKILSVDEITGIVVCEAGCILENVDAKAKEAGLTVPLDLGAKQSCHLGGNLSTNAGGLRVLRYGNLHGSVLGVEAILSNGKILDLMSEIKKDNTGYHLKHLFIGSEGTLGIVSKLALLCPTAPQAVHVAFLGLTSFDDVLKTFKNAKRYLGEILSSCEMIDAPGLKASVDHFNLKCPIEGYPFYMLIETSGSDLAHDSEKFHRFLETGIEKGEIQDGTITNEVGKIQEIWKLRELVPLGLIKYGCCFKYDISLPLREFYNIVHVMSDRVGSLANCVCGYGHLGDSNLHLTICCPEFNEEIHKLVEPYVYEYTSKVKGSISAEHGIGFTKAKYLSYSKSAHAIQMMREVKNLLDPNGILNPYKVLD